MKECLMFLLVAFLASIATNAQQLKPLDPANMDPTVAPCSNFYQYANGTWLSNNPIPQAYSSWGSFNILQDKNNEVLRGIAEEAATSKTVLAGSIAKKLGDFYAAGMDSVAIEKAGIGPIQKYLRKISNMNHISDVQQYIAAMHAQHRYFLYTFNIDQDAKNSTRYIVELYQGGLGLPDRDYYLNDDNRSKRLREEYLKHVAGMFIMLGNDREEADNNAQTVMTMETRLARASMTNVERRDPDKTYHLMSIDQLSSLAPEINWDTYFSTIGLPKPGDINVAQPDFYKEVSAMMKDVSTDEWKTYLRWHLVHSYAPYLNSTIVFRNFKFYGTTMTGAKELLPRWKRVLAVTNAAMGEALGMLYVKKAFSPEAKKRALEMVGNLREAFRERIASLEWMDEATKQASFKKLDAFTVKIGYPEKWKDYASLEVGRSSYVENIDRANEFNFKRELAKIGKPIDRYEWGMTPSTVNAYYNPSMNEIVFPAAILQPPFFDPNADDAVNYGGIGAVIGHEMTHGFDDEGSKFDAQGNLKNWWTPEVRKNFEQRAQVLEKEFSTFAVEDSLHVNGKLTLGENIADLGGLSIAYAALQKSFAKNGKPAALEGFSPEQRFFLSWAQVWRRNTRPEALRLQVKTDPHSPSMFRTNGPLANMKEFDAAFPCTGNASVLPEEQRARIWN